MEGLVAVYCPLQKHMSPVHATEEVEMRKFLVVVAVLVLALSAAAMAVGNGHDGPAPNAGNGVPDGSGFDNSGVGGADSFGPAPNSGDGVSDGSGLETPNGPNR